MTDRRWNLLGGALGVLAALAGTLAVVLFAIRFTNVWSLLAVTVLATIGSWLARRRAAHGSPAPLIAYDVALAVVTAVGCGVLVWSTSPAEQYGWPIIPLMLAPPLLVIWGLRAADTWRRVPVALTGAVPLIVVTSLGLSATGLLTDVRYRLAKDDFEAVALNPPPRGEGRDMRIGSFSARVFTRDDGAVMFRFGSSWTGLMYVPDGLAEPSPDDPRGYYRPWAPHWWTYDTD